MSGVDDIDSLRLMSGNVRGQPIYIAMHEFQGKNREQLRLMLQNGDPDEVRQILDEVAQKMGAGPGIPR